MHFELILYVGFFFKTLAWDQHVDTATFIYLYHLFVYFWLCGVFIAACGLSLVAESRASSLAVITSPVVEHRLQAYWLQ